MTKKIVLIFSNFEQEHFGKDVFLVPYYLGKVYDLDVKLVFPQTKTNSKLPNYFRGVELVSLSSFLGARFYLLKSILYLFFNAKKIDTLMQFHLSKNTLILGIIYKLLNRRGKLYVKIDGEYWIDNVLDRFELKSSTKINFLFLLYKELFRNVDLISIETIRGFNKLKSKNYFSLDLVDKFRLLINGFDIDLFKQFDIKELPLDKKENIFITVGRLGSYPKNTELILKAINGLKLINDWTVVLIGPIESKEQDFQLIIDDFYSMCPEYRDKIIFTGPIYDKRELWEWYNKAKVFLLPSRSEGSAMVLPEAYWFNNYIIATEVGGVAEVINNGYGEIIPQDNAEELRSRMQNIINNENFLLQKKENVIKMNISYDQLLRDILF